MISTGRALALGGADRTGRIEGLALLLEQAGQACSGGDDLFRHDDRSGLRDRIADTCMLSRPYPERQEYASSDRTSAPPGMRRNASPLGR